MSDRLDDEGREAEEDDRRQPDASAQAPADPGVVRPLGSGSLSGSLRAHSAKALKAKPTLIFIALFAVIAVVFFTLYGPKQVTQVPHSTDALPLDVHQPPVDANNGSSDVPPTPPGSASNAYGAQLANQSGLVAGEPTPPPHYKSVVIPQIVVPSPPAGSPPMPADQGSVPTGYGDVPPPSSLSGSPPGYGAQPTQAPTLSPAAAAEQAAHASSMMVTGAQAPASQAQVTPDNVATVAPPVDPQVAAAAYARSLAGQVPAGVSTPPAQTALVTNGQSEQRMSQDYVPAQVQRPISRYEVQAGTVIPSSLLSGIDTAVPGEVVAQVRENVYDFASGHFLLIPQGTRLLGTFDSNISLDQGRVAVVWARMIFPNGDSMDIGDMQATDQGGYNGIPGKVDYHTNKAVGAATMIALFGVAANVATGNKAQTCSTTALGTTCTQTVGQQVIGSLGQALSSVASNRAQQQLNLPPNIRIAPGTAFNVLVDRDMVMPGVYGTYPGAPQSGS